MSDFISGRKIQINFLDQKGENTFLLKEIALVSQLFGWLTKVTVCTEYYRDLFDIRKLKGFLISEKESLSIRKVRSMKEINSSKS